MRNRPNALRRLRSLCVAVLAVVPAIAAHAADWRYREPQAEGPVTLAGFVTATDGSIWSWDRNTVRHTGAAGDTRVVHRGTSLYGMASITLAGGGIALAANQRQGPDGAVGPTIGSCSFLQAGAGALPPRTFTHTDCRRVAFNRDGSAWVAGETTLYLLGIDGVQQQHAVLETQESPSQITALADGGVMVLARNSALTQSRLLRFDAQGSLRWQRTAGSASTFAATTDGGAYLVTSNPALSVTRLDAGGAELWSRGPQPFHRSLLQVAVAADGALHIVGAELPFTLLVPKTLLRISSDGSSEWQRPICEGGEARPFSMTVLDSDGNSATPCAQLLRRDRDGQTLAAITLPFALSGQMAALPAGGLRVLGADAGRSRLVDIDRDQHLQPSVADTIVDTIAAPLRTGAVDGDGASYLLIGRTLSKVGADGQPLWRTDTLLSGSDGSALSVAGGHVCTLQYRTVACMDSASGRRLWGENLIPGSGSNEQVFIAALEDGNSLAFVGRPGRYSLDLRDRNGALLRQTPASGQSRAVHLDSKGRVFAFVDNMLVRHDADGSVRYRVSQAVQGYPAAMQSDNDGNLYIAGRRDQERWLWAVGADGNTRWLRRIDGTDDSQVLLGAGAVYLLQPKQVQRYAADSGLLLWQYQTTNPRPSPYVLEPTSRIALNTVGDRLVLAATWNDRLRLERLDTARGTRVDERFVACGKACRNLAALRLDATGTARLPFTTLDDDGEGAAVIALSGLGGDADRIALDQPGIAGAWWSPYANGEGIAFDWLPDSRTLFGAWFTYRTEGGNDPAGLRWYTLQANAIAANANSLELPILETIGGNFAAGPLVAPRQVGTAALDFIDCNNGTLRYRFDAGVNDGRSGTITLSRLSPATQPCILADGSSQPAAGARPPSKGFDARQSGNWYDPATGGQGLQFTVQPDGVFFAPWFTFDPADTNNDAGRQHWFTLQGDLSTALNGRVQLQLVQTIGGAFDRVPTYNANAVGTATLRLLACDRAELDYRFGDDAGAGPFRTRSGTVRLQRAGGCAP